MKNGVCQLFLKFAYWVTEFWIRWPDYTTRKLLSLSLDLFIKIWLFRVTFLVLFSVAIFSPYSFHVSLLLQYVTVSVRELVRCLESLQTDAELPSSTTSRLNGCLHFLCFFSNIFNCMYIVCYLYEGRWLFQCIGSNYMTFMDYMDPDVHCPKKVVKLNHSINHSEGQRTQSSASRLRHPDWGQMSHPEMVSLPCPTTHGQV